MTQYRSYLLRLWRELEAIEILAWRGEIESIQSGQKWELDNFESFIGLLQSQVLTELANEPIQPQKDSGRIPSQENHITKGNRQRRSQTMAHLLVHQNVEDYAHWKEAFAGDAGVRRAGGSTGWQVFQSANDPNEVLILLEWDTMEKLRQFAQSDELRVRMEKAGMVGPPNIYFLNRYNNLAD